MMNGADGDGHPPPDEPEDGDPGDSAEALANATDAEVLALGAAVLAELKDRGLMRILLRNRADAATAYEVEAIREAPDGIDMIAAGFHAETPEDYPGWVEEAAALWRALAAPGLSDEAAEAMLGRATDEALLLALDTARLADPDDEEEEEGNATLPAAVPDGIGSRVALELLRRGVIEAEAEE